MEPDDLPDGVERVEKMDDDACRVCDTDGSVHTVRRRPQRRRGGPQPPGRV